MRAGWQSTSKYRARGDAGRREAGGGPVRHGPGTAGCGHRAAGCPPGPGDPGHRAGLAQHASGPVRRIAPAGRDQPALPSGGHRKQPGDHPSAPVHGPRIDRRTEARTPMGHGGAVRRAPAAGRRHRAAHRTPAGGAVLDSADPRRRPLRGHRRAAGAGPGSWQGSLASWAVLVVVAAAVWVPQTTLVRRGPVASAHADRATAAGPAAEHPKLTRTPLAWQITPPSSWARSHS